MDVRLEVEEGPQQGLGWVEPWIFKVEPCHKHNKGRWNLPNVNCTFIKVLFSIIEGCIFSLLRQEGWRMVTRLWPT